MHTDLWLIRHGETEWSKSGQHTSRTDLPLTTEGERLAVGLGALLKTQSFSAVYASPMQRARRTAELAGYQPLVLNDLKEWDYGDFEGLTTPQIQVNTPGWSIWTAPAPGGETPAQVATRADRVIDQASSNPGPAALFGHGHFLRVLAARWLGMPVQNGKYFALSTATVSILGYEREQRVLRVWNRGV